MPLLFQSSTLSFVNFLGKILPFISDFSWNQNKSHSSPLSHVYMYLLYIAVGHVLIDHRIMEGSCHPSVCIHCTVLQLRYRSPSRSMLLYTTGPSKHITVAIWPQIITFLAKPKYTFSGQPSAHSDVKSKIIIEQH